MERCFGMTETAFVQGVDIRGTAVIGSLISVEF